jgi:outer membrane receptor protein involved in Fe transport
MCPHNPWSGGITRRGNHWIDRALIGVLALINLSLAAQTAPPGTTTTTTTTVTPTTEQVSTAAAANQSQNENPVVMNPFDVNASSNVGYGAATTSSTARVVQSYVDVPQTVNVITSEFLEDYSSQDVRQALEYIPNIDFGLTDNPYSMHLRAANVTSTYIDGVTMPGQYNAMPFDFFDRIEVVKGPSSITFGLGQPGGLVNYVSKMPQGINSTSVSFGVGNDSNYLFRLDLQRVDKNDPKLSYRLAAFWDDGGYQYSNLYHSGGGAQLSVNYALNSTTNLSLILAYSNTVYPAQQYQNSIFAQETQYEVLQLAEVGNPVFTSLPGTKFPNGSIYGVSGPLPVPGTYPAAVGVFGTGRLVPEDQNLNPPGWDGNTNEDLRAELLITKSLADGHINLRNQLALEYDTNYVYEETPNAVYSTPGPNNTGATSAEVPGGNWVFDDSQGGPGAPLNVDVAQTFLTEQRTYSRSNASSRYDELDALADYTFFNVDVRALIGADFYDSEQYGYGYLIPNTNADGAQIGIYMYQPNNTPLYASPNGWTLTNSSSSHTWGDGFFAQVDALPFNGMFDLMAGWRIDYFDTETINYAGHSVSYPGWVNTKGAPRFAITYKPLKWLSIYELYTKHADPTLSTNKYFISSGTEDNPPLSTQFPLSELEFYQPGGYTIESGLKASFFGGKLDVSLAVFHEIVTGDLSPLVIARATNPDGTNTQIAEQVVTGFNAHGEELEIFGQLSNRLTFTANWGFTRGFYPEQLNNLSQETGQGNLYTPDWVDPPMTISGHFKYDFGTPHGNGFYVTFGTEFWSPYWVWQTSTFDVYYTSWQHQLDGGIGYRWRWGKYSNSVLFEMNNIENSQITIGTVTPWTEEPLRNWFVTYKVKY